MQRLIKCLKKITINLWQSLGDFDLSEMLSEWRLENQYRNKASVLLLLFIQNTYVDFKDPDLYATVSLKV